MVAKQLPGLWEIILKKEKIFVKFNVLADIIDFNPYLNTVTFKCSFLTPENIEIIENVIKEKKKSLKVSFDFSTRNTKQYFQQKFYYWFLKQILIKYGSDVNSENLHVMDEDIRRNVFPCSEIDVDGKILKQPMRMRQLSFDQMQQVIETLKDRYSHLGIDYSGIEGSSL